MFRIENHIGNIIISEKYLKQIIEYGMKDCFGVAGISTGDPIASIASKLGLSQYGNGIDIYVNENNCIVVNLHLIAVFGTNINAVVKSAVHKVSFILDEALGNADYRVNVFVDDINS